MTTEPRPEAIEAIRACQHSYNAHGLCLACGLDVNAELDALRQQLAEAKQHQTGPGTPSARLDWLAKELRKRWVDPEPLSAQAFEPRFLQWLDDRLKALAEAEAERERLKDAILPEWREPQHAAFMVTGFAALASAHRQDTDIIDSFESDGLIADEIRKKIKRLKALTTALSALEKKWREDSRGSDGKIWIDLRGCADELAALLAAHP